MLAMTILWLDVLIGAVLLALLVSDDAVPLTAGVGLVPFVVSGFLVLVYVAAAGVALGSGVAAAFVAGSAIAAASLLLRDRRREHVPTVSTPS